MFPRNPVKDDAVKLTIDGHSYNGRINEFDESGEFATIDWEHGSTGAYYYLGDIPDVQTWEFA